MEHDDQADRLERDADRLEHFSEEVADDIDDARRDWDQKQHDASVPGAQPDPGDEEVEGPEERGGSPSTGSGAV